MRLFISFMISWGWAFAASAQPVPPVSDTDSLEAYLEQAFKASESRYRASLFHIGIEAAEIEAGYLVTAVLESYPAFTAGINRGDIIVSSNDKPFHPIRSFSTAEDSRYDLLIDRGGDLFSVTVTPVYENLFDSYRSATLESVQEFSAGNKVIGYLRLWALSRGTSDLVSFQSLMSGLNHCDGLILDLRSTFGFLDDTHLDALQSNLSDTDYFGEPIVIIVNSKTSARAAELARQLKRLDRIVILGDVTKSGLTPELTAPYPFTQTSRNDPQFEAAFNRLLGTI